MTSFPTIQHIDDVIHEFRDRREFGIFEKDGYTVIDYNYVEGPETFASSVLREGRGLKFGPDGKLIARPFHKFFNLNERPESHEAHLDWTQDISVMEKLDGSMIHPAMVNGEFVFMTRKGVTDTALQAMRETVFEKDRMIAWMADGWTPIYEFTSPNNRIVVEYEKPELRLLALRNNLTGKYMDVGPEIDLLANGDFSLEKFVADVRSSKNREGVVLRWPSGHMVKLKADDYVSLHRNINLMGSEFRVLELILDGKHDDLLPMLSDQDRALVEDFSRAVNFAVAKLAFEISRHVAEWKDASQKDFALWVQEYVDKRIWSVFFKIRQEPYAAKAFVRETLRKLTNSESNLEANRDLIFDARLRPIYVNGEINE